MHKIFLRIGLFFVIRLFYKKVQAKNMGVLKPKRPVIIAMNHPNAFTDPLILTHLSFPQKLWYLARGDVFKRGLAAALLRNLRIIPVFRQRDAGKAGLIKNTETYRTAFELLEKRKKIMVFAEGLCVQERRLRKLKKGVPRLFFGAFEKSADEDLVLLPVGVNYSQPDKFRSDVFYNIGEPISVKDYLAEYRNNPTRAQKRLLDDLEAKMKDLIVHIDDKRNDKAVCYYEKLRLGDLMKEQSLDLNNLEHHLRVSKQITAVVNRTAKTEQAALDHFSEKAGVYFDSVHKAGLRDWIIDPLRNGSVNFLSFALRSIVLAGGLPVYLCGLILNYPALRLTSFITKKNIRYREFYSSVWFIAGILTFLMNYLLLFFIPLVAGAGVIYALMVCLVSGLSGWFCLFYHPYLLNTAGMFRALVQRARCREFAVDRAELIAMINKF